MRPSNCGFTLIELMISMTVALVLLAALVGMFVSTSRSNSEFANTNSVIENGRFALQLLEQDAVHAGYWGGYVPQFDSLISSVVPGDVPASAPNVCLPYANWDHAYRIALVGIPVQTFSELPAGAGCVSPLAQRPGTDVLVLRHAETCVPGTINCDADVAGRLYFQMSLCGAEANAGTLLAATPLTVTFGNGASSVDNIYQGLTIRVGDRLFNTITAYIGATRTATLANAWLTVPLSGTAYSFEYMLGTNQFPLHLRNCVGTGAPAGLPITAGTPAAKRWYMSSMYYVHNLPHPDRPGEIIPTLVRSRLDNSGGTLVHGAPVQLISGVESFRIMVGIDDRSDSGDPVDYSAAVVWADPNNKTSPTNRGDGQPDRYKRCTTAVPCAVGELMNVVSLKLWVLARSRDPSPGFTDSRVYCLGELEPAGTCNPADVVGPMNDSYQRQLFSTSVRLVNVAGRRETPL